MPPLAGDRSIRDIKNKVVRGEMLKKEKREKAQAKLKKRIERKEAENRGEEVERGRYKHSPRRQKDLEV